MCLEENTLSPFMSIRDKDGRSSDNPPLNMTFLLLVNHQQMVGIKLDGIPHLWNILFTVRWASSSLVPRLPFQLSVACITGKAGRRKAGREAWERG